MTNQAILNTIDHRPWKLPSSQWSYYQEWNNAVFLHWQVELKLLKKLVPEDLEIDLFDGQAWVSVVVFTMDKMRPRNLPSMSFVSKFEEINIRTYVKFNNKAGVYFLSIEGSKKLSCKLAKAISELPYRYSKISRNENNCQSSNSETSDYLNVQYSTGELVLNKPPLDKWLTERYALFQDTMQGINEFEIHHLEWPVKNLMLEKFEFNYPKFNPLLKAKPDRVQYSEGVKVLAWERIR